MDISRLPLTPVTRPASPTFKRPQPARAIAVVESAGATRNRPRGGGRYERVLQGELLRRERLPYQSTHAFINERAFGQANPADRQAGDGYQSRPAVTRYLGNTRPETLSDLTQGRSVNFFV